MLPQSRPRSVAPTFPRANSTAARLAAITPGGSAVE